MLRVSVSLIFATTILFISSVFGAETPRDESIRVLLLSGQNNHDWQETTPKIKSILEASGQFTVEMDEHPQRLTSKRLQAVQVVLSNWNTYGSSAKSSGIWPPAVREGYIEFVRRGGGHVVVHAGSSSFYDWDEYHKLTLAAWQEGKTDHGPSHAFKVQIDATDHPIAKGVSNFKYFGELWHRPALQENVVIVASAYSSKDFGGSGQQEPVAVAKQFGKGRSFTLLLGHDAAEMDNSGFSALLTRGTQWAATGKTVAPGEVGTPDNTRSNRRDR